MGRLLARTLAACLLAAGFAAAAHAVSMEEPLPDPRQENQARVMFQELRCVVCQGQPLAESNAALAKDMRAFIRRKLAEGESPQTIERFLVARYGRDILLNPPKEKGTAPLWIAPFVVLPAGWALSRRYRVRSARRSG